MARENDSIGGAVVIGALMGFLSATALNMYPTSYAAMAKTAIAECEKSLPRDQECIVIAIPAPRN